MNRYRFSALFVAGCSVFLSGQSRPVPVPGTKLPAHKVITEQDCTAEKLGARLPVGSIGLPVSAIPLTAPQWHAEANGNAAYCAIEGSMAPVDKSSTARPIRFGVAMPASWSYRAVQLGGGGMNGSVPGLTGGPGRSGESYLKRGLATYGSDSGHQGGGFGPSNPAANDWALNDVAIANLGYMQLKKTHDAAMVLMRSFYGDL